MKNNQGFTLVELLAVILLLTVITLIAIPVYNNFINESKESAYKDSMYTLIKELEGYVISDTSINYNEEVSITSLDLELNNYNITSGNFYVRNNFVTLINMTDGNYCANGNKNDLTISEGSC